jgi:echinoderm microtubule-associated protein-like 6
LFFFFLNIQRLASCGIDQDSIIGVWDWKKGKLLAKSTGHQERVFDLQFSPTKENCLVSCGIKHMSFWSLIGNTLKKKNGLFGNIKDMQTMFCFTFGTGKEPGDEVCYAGTMNGQIYMWLNNELKEIYPSVHSSSVYSIIKVPNGYITGGKGARIVTWDKNFNQTSAIDMKLLLETHPLAESLEDDDIVIRSLSYKDNKLIIGSQDSDIFEINLKEPDKINYISNGHSEGELWSLAVSPINPDIFATGSDDKSVRIWNLKTNKLIKIAELGQKVRSCDFSIDEKYLACGLSNGTLVVLKTEDMKQVFSKKHRNEVLHEMKYSPCGKYLAVGSNDNFVDVFSVPDYNRLGVCAKNSSFITHLDWSKDSKYIQTNSGDGAHLMFSIPSCKQFTDKQTIEWKTFTGVLGKEVTGIWEKYTNKTDINATDVNFKQKIIVTGDDFGLVKLFRFPSLKKGAKFRKYVGHSSHVTNVRFTKDHSRVISIGGADHAIFQWRYIDDKQNDDQVSTGGSNLKTDQDNSLPQIYDAYMDSNSEDSDSEMSGKEVDSDIENEKEMTYDREVYKDDLKVLKPKLKEEIKKAEADSGCKRQTRPNLSLGLEFVYGYRGYDCRDNLFFIRDTGEMVYHVAAIGIVYNKETRIQKFYDKHTDDILSLSIHPLKNYVATGQIGRDPHIHVWDIETMRTLSVLKGQHFRGICSLNFSADGKKLASVGLDDNHMICVWDWKKGEKLATTRGHKDKIFCIKWNPHGTDSLVTVGVKHIKFWNQVGGGFTSKRGLFGDLSGVENIMCITFGKQPDLCYTGAANGSIYVWQNQKLIKTIEAHKGPVFAIYATEKWDAYVTGGKDGSIILWNNQFTKIHKYSLNKESLTKESRGLLLTDCPSARAICLASKKILIGTKNGEIIEIDKDGIMNIVIQGHGEGEVWGLACHPSQLECCTVSDDKTLRIWSLEHKKNSLLRGKSFDKLGRSCAYSPTGKLIAVGFKEGQVIVLNADTLDIIETVNHRNQEIAEVKFSPVAGKYLAVGSHENTVDIYNVENKKRVGICKGASSYITHVEWDVEGHLLMLNSGAKEILYYEAPRGNRINIREEDMAKIEWSTFTSVLGKNCEGIWPPYTDITDVNSTCLTKDRHTLATGDDFGLVKLFQYPCIGKFSKFKKYNAHSSHVTRVRWSHDDSKLITIGGNDTSVMVWKCLDDNTNDNDPDKDADIKRNSRKGESDESDTDSEEEGYDSDVQLEQLIDYNKNFFEYQVKRPSSELVQKMYNKVKTTNKNELSKPSRMVDSKFKRTKINKIKSTEGKEVDPLTLVHFMAKMSAFADETNSNKKTNSEKNVVKQDITGLKLSYVHGYRGNDCRDNLFYANDGNSIVYHAAGAGIVLDVASGNQSFYLEHDDDIISLCVNDNPKFKNVIATGQIGIKPVIHVWDCNTKETLSILSELHSNSQGICSLSFSSSGKLLVSVGLDSKYTVGVWRWKEGQLVASASADSKPNRIFRATFRPDSDTVFASVGIKHVKFWSIAGSALLARKGNLNNYTKNGKKLKKMTTMLSLGFGQVKNIKLNFYQ